MNRRSSDRNLTLQFVAAFYGSNMLAAQQNSEQFPRSVVQGLRDALLIAISEIKSLKDKNKSLKTQVGQLKNSQVKVSQLQEQLKEKEEALQRARKTSRVETLDMLARTSEQWRSRCDALEESLRSTTNQLQVLTSKIKVQEEEMKTSEEKEKEPGRLVDSGKTSASFPLKPQPASFPLPTSPTPVFPSTPLYPQPS